MKIAIFVRILWIAGAPRIAIREAKELSKLGHDVKLIFLRRSNAFFGYEDMLDGIDYEIIADSNKSLLVPLYDYLTGKFVPDKKGEGRVDYNLIRKIPYIARNEKADIVICHDQYTGIGGYYAFKKFGIPYNVVLHERVDIELRTILHKLEDRYMKKTLQNACRVTAMTDKIGRTAFEQHGIRCEVSYPGLDFREFNKFENKENTLITISFWSSWRRPMFYLDVLERLPDFTLYMVGNWIDKNLRNEFVEKIEQRNLSKRVILISGIRESELRILYDKSKFVVRFGYGEYGVAMAVIEGLQSGVPVIINKELGSSEFVEKYGVGQIIEELDPVKVSNSITRLNNEASYSEIQTRILKLETDYSWVEHAKKLIC